MFALLEIARIYNALKRFADLQGPICYKDAPKKLDRVTLTETAFNHQLSTKQPSNVTIITLLKHTSDSEKTPSKLGTKTTLHHSVTQNTGTLRN